MSRFFSEKYSKLKAYTPGEQPVNRKYIKLNTNESPFPPSESVLLALRNSAPLLNLYPDPECRELSKAVADLYGVSHDQVLMTNGSDEILNFAFMAFGDETRSFAFPDITYGFYSVFADLNHIPYKVIPLSDDFTVNTKVYENIGMNIVIANPNAPTGLILSPDEIERIVSTNRDSVVIIDEAYIDFGGESCIPLIKKYDNLLVTRTFSKSYSLAGARLGFGIGSADLIKDLNTIKYSTNPYNINRSTMAAGLAAIEDNGYYMDNCNTIINNREFTKKMLISLGFSVTDSKTNFLFVSHPSITGRDLYLELKKEGILVRHFDSPRIDNHVRITIGTIEQMNEIIFHISDIINKRSNI